MRPNVKMVHRWQRYCLYLMMFKIVPFFSVVCFFQYEENDSRNTGSMWNLTGEAGMIEKTVAILSPTRLSLLNIPYIPLEKLHSVPTVSTRNYFDVSILGLVEVFISSLAQVFEPVTQRRQKCQGIWVLWKTKHLPTIGFLSGCNFVE